MNEIIVQNNELADSFFATVYNDNVIDIGTELLEVGLDQITENDILKEIPIVGTVVKLGKVAISVRDRHLLKSALIFANEIKKCPDRESVISHREKLLNNPKKLQEESEFLILYLDRQLGYEKSILYANLYRSYITVEEFEWEDFQEFGEMIDGLFISDVQTLIELYEKKRYIQGEEFNFLALKRLDALGLVDYFNGSAMSDGRSSDKIMAIMNPVGEVFCKYVLADSGE